jgi:hypothetical protein
MVDVVPTQLCATDFLVWGAMLAARRKSKQQLRQLCIPYVRSGVSLRNPRAFARRAAVQAVRFCGTAAVFMSACLRLSAVYHLDSL